MSMNRNEQVVYSPNLLDWQLSVYQSIVNGDEKYHTIVSSRQIGKSTLASVLILEFAINNALSSIGVASITFRQCKQIFKVVENILKQTSIYKSSSQTTMEIELMNGSKIVFITAQNPEGARGYTFTHLIMDEMAFYPEDFFSKILQPTTLVRGEKVVAFSTPRGTNNEFAKLYSMGNDIANKNYVSYSFDYTFNPYLPKDEILAIQKQVPEAVFNQEYLCSFTNDGGVFGNIDMICLLDTFSVPNVNNNYYIGIDTAIQNDFAVATVMNENGDVVDIYRNRTSSIKVLENDLIKFIKRWNPVKVLVEKNNIGVAIIETLWQHFPKSKILEFITTNDSKNDIIHELIRSIEERKIKLPSKELFPELYKEMNNFTFKLSDRTKVIQYSARAGSHDDCVISLALTNHLIREYTIKKTRRGTLAYRVI